MLIILKTCEELCELCYESKERAMLAIECKQDCPSLASAYIDIANNGLSQADKLHSAIIQYIDKIKASKTLTEEMMDVWKYKHEKYIEMYECAKMKITMYNKM